ncbi:MAG: right-handed parallel beta-helix repeat-containing protein, partial [Nanoarchaeota archaeon]|nr:right-handed parallel beta-helix repeat-containing protein [Nanoarchaeota archaeon]
LFLVFLVSYIFLGFFTFVYSVNINSCQVISSSGIYTFNQTIIYDWDCFTISSSDVILDCAGYILRDGTGGSSAIIISDTYNNITIKNCNIQNYSTSIMTNGDNVFILNNNISYNGYGLYLDDGGGSTNVSGNRFWNNTASGIQLRSNSNIIDSNYFENNTPYGINYISGINNLISNNNFTDDYAFLDGDFGVYVDNYEEMDLGGLTKDITLVNNQTNYYMTSNFTGNLFFYYRDGIVLDCQGNSIVGDGTDNGIYFTYSDNNLINNCITQGHQDGLEFYRSDNNVLTNMTFKNNTNYGLYYIGYDNNIIQDSLFIDNGITGVYYHQSRGQGFYYRNNFTDDHVYFTGDDGTYINNTCDRDLSKVSSRTVTLVSTGDYYFSQNCSDCRFIFSEVGNINLDCNDYSMIGAGSDTGIIIGEFTDGTLNNNISNCIIENYSKGIYYRYADNGITTNVTARNNVLYGFDVSRDADGNTIQDSITYDNGLYGLYTSHNWVGYNNNIYRNNFSNDYAFIWYDRQFNIENNTYNMDITNITQNISLIAEGIHTINNYLYNKTLYFTWKDGAILDCNGYGLIGNGSETALNFYYTNYANISNCLITNYSNAVYLERSEYNDISNSTFENNFYDINLEYNSDNNYFYGNTFDNGSALRDDTTGSFYFYKDLGEGNVGNFWKNISTCISNVTRSGYAVCTNPATYNFGIGIDLAPLGEGVILAGFGGESENGSGSGNSSGTGSSSVFPIRNIFNLVFVLFFVVFSLFIF